MQKDNVVSSASVANFIRQTLGIAPQTPKKENEELKFNSKRKRLPKTKIRKSNINQHDTNSNINTEEQE